MAAPTGPETAGRLAAGMVAAYQAQLDAYREWLALARQAQVHLRRDEVDEFLRVHAEKEAVTGRLPGLEQRVQECRRALASFVGTSEPTLGHLQQATAQLADPAFAQAVADLLPLLDQLRAIMQELQAVEADTEQLLRERLIGLRADLTQTQTTRRAARAYQGPDQTSDHEPRFIDHKG